MRLPKLERREYEWYNSDEIITMLQAVICELQQEEEKLAGLLMRKLISDKTFRAEQQSIKARIREQQEYIRQLQRNNI